MCVFEFVNFDDSSQVVCLRKSVRRGAVVETLRGMDVNVETEVKNRAS